MFWYHDELDRVEEIVENTTYNPKLVFYGSSSFNYWEEISEEFKEFKPLNLAFGGSTLAACSWFFDRVFTKVTPEAVIVYAGDNDLGDGRHPEEVVLFFQTLLYKIRNAYGNIPVAYVSIKPSLARWELRGSIRYTNSNIRDLGKTDANFHFIDIYDAMLNKEGTPEPSFFAEDGLHLSEKGYDLWLKIIKEQSSFFLNWGKATITCVK